MTSPNASASPNPDDNVSRRLEALRSASEVSGNATKDDQPNLPAQKLLVILARLLGNQVNADKAAAVRYQYLETELNNLRERSLSKDVFMAVCGSQRDTLETVSEQMSAMEHRQQELWDLLVKLAVVLGLMLLGLAVIVGILAGGIR